MVVRRVRAGVPATPGAAGVQAELEELTEQLIAQVEQLLEENHRLKAKIEAKKARAKERQRGHALGPGRPGATPAPPTRRSASGPAAGGSPPAGALPMQSLDGGSVSRSRQELLKLAQRMRAA